MTANEAFVEMIYNGYPEGRAAIFDNAYKSACEGRSA